MNCKSVLLTVFASSFMYASPAREIVELQRDVASLQEQVRTLQRTVDERMAALTTLVQQALEANNRTNTSVAAFSPRARPGAPVSMPVAWKELTPSRPPDRYTLARTRRRLARLARDPWRDYWRARQTIPPGAVQALERL